MSPEELAEIEARLPLWPASHRDAARALLAEVRRLQAEVTFRCEQEALSMERFGNAEAERLELRAKLENWDGVDETVKLREEVSRLQAEREEAEAETRAARSELANTRAELDASRSAYAELRGMSVLRVQAGDDEVNRLRNALADHEKLAARADLIRKGRL